MLHYAGCSGSIQYRDHERVTAVVVGVVFKLHPRQRKFVAELHTRASAAPHSCT